ncbi:MAG: thiol:disulfide interchange protein DsbA/DsbL [Gammaproteobacteria bacterium]|nr:thiol:disulfide interchange protein DsbA/DsbL [Gammaproteobacteria bacterium]MCW8910517.1 thiol:disulfide interchange protein DsbA/DsbL [Gammaproteobacteria bacterium]MCW9005174.1 thiol:disulfide interchange protein DsbA/DsbL [Gammaproteobacteria bacterium]MCW9057190.1 thiol:disulfide interchange protein DsbA/DsbL [Gammaproteobacteria bacterium]
MLFSKLIKLSLFIFILMASSMVAAKDYDEGIDYNKLAKPQTTDSGNKIEVLEFFWYGCPHCYQFEPALSQWLKNKPANVNFIRIPAPLNPNWMVHTKAYYTLELLGEGEKFHEDLFKAIHEKKMRLNTPAAIADFLADKGVDKKAFIDSFDSFAVEMRARKAMQLSRSFKLDGVPLLAVNGKYTVSASQAGGYKQMIDITNHLIKKETK